jgi:RNase P protein component
MPGFTAEASLNRVTEFYRMVSSGRQMQRTQVLPQLVGYVHLEGRDPKNNCHYVTIDITVDTDKGTATERHSVTNICAHP